MICFSTALIAARIHILRRCAGLRFPRTFLSVVVELVQYVATSERAWHAGKSAFSGRENCNDFSIGVELEGTDERPYTQPQYRRLVMLSVLLLRAFPDITPARIVGHSDVAPGRKSDPGPAFDWPRYRQALTEALAAKYP